MPLFVFAFVLIAFPALIALSVPLSIVQRYRAGTARRVARPWVAAINVISLAISVALFLVSSAVSSHWIPGAFTYSLIGLAGGCVLGRAGLALSRWEATPKSLHYTPNRWLVLSLMSIVIARIAFGFWRAWTAWHRDSGEHSWLAESGLAGAMAVGALVIGYYFTYWAGVWTRARNHRRMHQQSA